MLKAVIKNAQNQPNWIEVFQAPEGEYLGQYTTVNSFKKANPEALIIQNTSQDQSFKSELKGRFIYIAGRLRKIVYHNLQTGIIEWHTGGDHAKNLVPNSRKNSTAQFELKQQPKK